MEREFDVTSFIRCWDNQGNSEHLHPGAYYRVSDFSAAGRRALGPGDVLVAEVEVDASFDASEYSVVWWVKTATERGQGTRAAFRIEERHVRERMEEFKLTTNREWHRGGDSDDVLDPYYKVLPP
jgi:hypothetical protein